MKTTIPYTPYRLLANHIPVLDGVEGLLVGDVIHQNEAHSAAVVSCGDGAVPLLPRRVLETKTQKSHHEAVRTIRTGSRTQ